MVHIKIKLLVFGAVVSQEDASSALAYIEEGFDLQEPDGQILRGLSLLLTPALVDGGREGDGSFWVTVSDLAGSDARRPHSQPVNPEF